MRRSYLDRLAFIGGIVVILGGLLAFIVLRVLRAPRVDDDEESGEDTASDVERYTDSESDAEQGPDSP